MIEAVTALAAVGVAVTAGCALVGLPRATYYRLTRGYRHYQPVAQPLPQAQRSQPAALTPTERAAVLDILLDPQFESLSVCQTYWRAFDLGVMPCSQRTFYRIAKAQKLVGDRRRGRHGGGTPRRTPRVSATAPGHLWSWDVTDLKCVGGQTLKLYLVIDVFSRFPVAWRIEHTEHERFAVQMFAEAFARYGPPRVLHADNGAIMRCTTLLDLLEKSSAVPSFSRPRISDDNPFSESLFKTVKYDQSCPPRFADIEHARTWSEQFLHRYAHEHRHSGIGWYTPAAVFDGTAIDHQGRRQALLDLRYEAHPERFRRPPQAPTVPPIVGINHKKQQQRQQQPDLSQTG